MSTSSSEHQANNANHSDVDELSNSNESDYESYLNIQDETDIEREQMYCFGDSLNEIQIYLFFLELHDQLLSIRRHEAQQRQQQQQHALRSEAYQQLNASLDDVEVSGLENRMNSRKRHSACNNDLDADIKKLTKYLRAMDLFRVTVRPRSLQLLLDIIAMCESTLKCVDFELQIRESNLVPMKCSKNSKKVTATMKQIYRQKSAQIIRQSSIISDEHYDGNLIENEIKFIFDLLMRKLSALPLLQDFGIDIVNFPLSCYDYHKYFAYDAVQSKCSFGKLRDIHLNLGNKEMLRYKESSKQSLYEWIKHHRNVKKISIKVVDYEDWHFLEENARLIHRDRDHYKKRFTLTYGDRRDIQLIVHRFLEGVMQNAHLVHNLEKFYFHDELSGIYDYHEILVQLLGSCKLQQLEWLSLSFNDMRDVYLNRVVLSLLHSQWIHRSLCHLALSWLNSCDKNWRYPVWNERFLSLTGNDDQDEEHKQDRSFYHDLQHHRADYLCGLRYPDEQSPKQIAIDDEEEELRHLTVQDVLQTSITSNSIHNKHSVKCDTVSYQHKMAIQNDWKSLHFAQHTLRSLASFVAKCTKLTSLSIKCCYGVNVDDFARFIEIIANHSVMDELQFHALQSTRELMQSLQCLFVNEHAFLRQVAVLFIKYFPQRCTQTQQQHHQMHHAHAFTLMQNTIDDECMRTLIDVVLRNQSLFEHARKSITDTLLNLRFAHDVSKIIIEYVFDVDCYNVELYGLLNSIKHSATAYLQAKQQQQEQQQQLQCNLESESDSQHNNILQEKEKEKQDQDVMQNGNHNSYVQRKLRFNDFR